MTLMPARTGSSVRARRLLVAVHVLVTVSWLGGAYATLVLAVSATSASYALIQLYDLAIVVPLGLAALVSGVVLAGWAGLFAQPWVVAKLVLTVLALAGSLLLRAGFVVDAAAGDARAASRVVTGSVVILVALVAIALLGMYRPWGRRASRR
ncbi:hypothetical protein [Nonomuraea turcica]|uniref:hypothetical protein n=1 Tax=Nonomuraea sp. G32 TaxID=3067274 RepID=UPI00273AEFB1|nr:hypothetical protein [Nonomuraea sp. G32]MDP4511975.1 hypothetical protein [Nonomuraea sp. G32]